MMAVFGSWSDYQQAPEDEVVRQILLWQARLQVQAEQEQRQQAELEVTRRWERR